VLTVSDAPVGLGLVGPPSSDLALIALAAGTLLHPEVA
jgi:Asp-tRNA(Asn)/Glu-tRNA(Gln) amidotransferase A subunit family amidase